MLTIGNDRLVVRLSPQGGAVVDGHLRDGRPFLRPYGGAAEAFTVLQAGCFPLVPLGNRVEDNGFVFGGKRYAFQPNTDEPYYIHGDGWLSHWEVAEKTAESCAFRLRHSSPETSPQTSPYIYEAWQVFEVEGAALRVEIGVVNRGPEMLPFGIGLHPYFPRTAETRLKAAAASWWSEGAGYLPERHEPIAADADFGALAPLPDRWLCNCYEGWDGQAEIIWPENRLAARISAGPVFSRYMLYAPVPERSFFCLEPMSHTINALAMDGPNGMVPLQPGATLRGSMTIEITDWTADA